MNESEELNVITVIHGRKRQGDRMYIPASSSKLGEHDFPAGHQTVEDGHLIVRAERSVESLSWKQNHDER